MGIAGYNYKSDAKDAAERYKKDKEEDIIYVETERDTLSLTLGEAENIAESLFKIVCEIKDELGKG